MKNTPEERGIRQDQPVSLLSLCIYIPLIPSLPSTGSLRQWLSHSTTAEIWGLNVLLGARRPGMKAMWLWIHRWTLPFVSPPSELTMNELFLEAYDHYSECTHTSTFLHFRPPHSDSSAHRAETEQTGHTQKLQMKPSLPQPHLLHTDTCTTSHKQQVMLWIVVRICSSYLNLFPMQLYCCTPISGLRMGNAVDMPCPFKKKYYVGRCRVKGIAWFSSLCFKLLYEFVDLMQLLWP